MSGFASTIEYLRELNFASTILRMLFAIIFGGLIGMEREHKHRPAGFRTYMLVCLGSALTMMLGQYLDLMLSTKWLNIGLEVGTHVDVVRIGAQVISGIGFIGAGTIILTSHYEIKGTTTAAGLWASACMGLAIGAGFYECMILGFVLIFICFKIFPFIEDNMVEKSKNMNIYIEVKSISSVNNVIDKLKSMDIKIYDIEIERNIDNNKKHPSAVFTLLLPKKMRHTQVISELSAVSEIASLEEI